MRAVLAALLLSSTIVPIGPSVAAEPLRRLAEARGIRIGTAVASGPLAADPAYANTLEAQFGSVTAEDDLKWPSLRPAAGQFDFTRADRIVDFATAHGQSVRGHTLVWHSALPAWLTGGGFTPAQLRAILKEHVETVVGRYRGRVAAWDVANEVLAEDGTLRQGFWLDNLGPGYIADAFRWARAADPQAKLYLNEYGAEQATAKAKGLFHLLRELKAQGVPVDGVGFQTHVLAWTRLSGLADVMRRVAALDLDVAVTELDVRMPLPTDAKRLSQQADVYGWAVQACLAQPRCGEVTTWGFTDTHSWIGRAHPGWGAATLFDAAYQAKPAFEKVAQTLTDWRPAQDGPVGWWRLDDWAGSTATDASPIGKHATASNTALGGAGRTPGYPAFRGDGIAAHASTAGPVLATDRPFTVTAWASLTTRQGYRVVAAQDGAVHSAFYLEYQPDYDRWAFIMPSADAQTTAWQTVLSTSAPAIGVWTHLAAVWTGSHMLLYVNGALQGTLGATAWASAGAFHIGRSRSGGWFSGGISDVRAFQRALTAQELTTVGDPAVARWGFDGHTGDASFFMRDGFPRPEALSWAPDRSALHLTGGEAVDVRPAVLDTARSFTISARVRLDAKGDHRVVAAQDGVHRSAFYLEYHQDYDRWAFLIPTADARTTGWQTVLSAQPPTLGAWTQLTAVWNAGWGRMQLYVDGRLQGTLAATAWTSNGTFHIGQSLDGGRFAGAVEYLVVHAGAQ
jgi:endo-1,4-beta-xylanase